MTKTLRDIVSRRIVPVAVIDDAARTAPLVDALRRGGLDGIEITLRTPAALKAISIAAAQSDCCVGAGTVLGVAQADAALAAGAAFIVTPGLDLNVVRHCLDKGVGIIPGVCTPSEVQAAMGAGLELLKFFPAEAMGGVKMLRALCAVYRDVRFMPTGGISPANLGEYLALAGVAACGGSWMVKKSLVAAGDWKAIAELTREAVACAQKAGA